MAPTTPFLEQTWRWFGAKDPVPLQHIAQAGATGVVTALHEISNGDVWPIESIRCRQQEIERANLRWSVVESVPVHEDIKLDTGEADRYLANYARTLRNLANCGIQTVCYNFMPLLDWTRTHLAWILPDGAEALRYDAVDAAVFDLFLLNRDGASRNHSPEIVARATQRYDQLSDDERHLLTKTILLGLPGTVHDLTLEEFRTALATYKMIDATRLRANHASFLRSIVPIAEECGISLCIHPDDPPFSIFGLPRIASTGADLDAILASVDSPSNGITFCSGSLGALEANDLPAIFRQVGRRVHFLHLRNVQRESGRSFYEASHLGGSTDMAALMLAILEELDHRATQGTSKPLPMRPDHGHRILGDLQHDFYPGYSAIGRLKGLAELRGLEQGLRYRRAHS